MSYPGGFGPPPGGPNAGQPQPPVCYRHGDRPTGLSCNRCGRPACPECLREAAVGYQCVDCVRAGQQSQRPVRTAAGARVHAGFTPYVTYALIAVNVVVFAVTAIQAQSVWENDRGSSLFNSWALYPPAVANGDYVRLIGSGFLHFGPVHLLVNMFALWIVGRDVELVLGRWRYLGVYVVSILGASAAVMVLQTNAVTAGASGGIFGLFGALAIILVRLRQSPGPVLVVIAINVIISVSLPGISIWGHLGGLVAGTLASVGALFVPVWLAHGRGLSGSVTRAIGWGSIVAIGVLCAVVIAVRIEQLRTQVPLV
ncbi:rhomboid family intramembrane serine protease [Skermania sp. ID1734]|uniref:rhomboid family intramembrane serine protease n=1 Tax=Skermania sp. ID1734 TaxID=2597516 RepID=UPI00117E658A|nr:rhomboid family intramembrane serine protease [Skermania sp. ID1734]TSD99226.1 rhomboid family intramembrane serine protease [Skermania sp. ID1734]